MNFDPWLVLGRIPVENWLVLAVCTVAFVGFYVLDYRRWGCLSFGSYFFGFNYFLKIVVMYPFAWSAHNIVATTSHFEEILVQLDRAFYLTLIGFGFMLCGIFTAKVTSTRTPFGCGAVYTVLRLGWSSGGGIAIGVTLVIGLTVLLFALGFQPFVARSLVFERTELRPVYNLWSQIIPFIAINTILYGDVRKRWPIIALGVGMALLGVVGGNRTVAILTLMQVAVMVSMPRRFANLPLLILGAVGLASTALSISTLRGDSMTTREQIDMLQKLLYGNDLSDLRDFAWILTGLDAVGYYWGKTYIAGYLSFIPTFLFPFREEYGFGRVTPMLAGLDPAFHSGLRPPIYGEMYVNFGLPGLCLGGFLYGIMVGRIMHWIARTLDMPDGPAKPVPQLVVWSGFLVLQIVDCLVFTPSFFGVYVLLGLLMLGATMARIGARR